MPCRSARRWRAAVTKPCGSALSSRSSEGLAGLVELGEEVALALDVVAHPVRWRQRQAVRAFLRSRQRPELGQPAAVGVGAVEPHDGVGHAWRALRHLGHLAAGHREVTEQRVGEHFGEVAGACRLVVGRETADVDVVDFGQAQQHLGRDWPLVALEQVEVAGRDGKVFGHAGLGKSQVATEAAQAGPEEQLSFRRLGHGDGLSQIHNHDNVNV